MRTARTAEPAPLHHERGFGVLVAAGLAVVAVMPLVNGHGPRWAFLAASVVLMLLSALQPALLRPVYKLWMAISVIISRVTNPVVLAVLFFGVIVPFGVLLRVFGKTLPLAKDRSASSYWIIRPSASRRPASMAAQF